MAQTLTPYKWLKTQTQPYKKWILITALLSFVSGLLMIAQSYGIAKIIYQTFILKQNSIHLNWLFLILITIVLTRAILAWLKERAGFKTSAKVRRHLRQSLIQHIHKLGPVYANQIEQGEYNTTVIEQVEKVHGFYAFYLPQMIIVMMLPLAMLAFIFPLSWVAGLILLVTAPLIPFFMALIGMGAASISQQQYTAMTRMSHYFLDLLQGLVTLKLFNRQEDASETIQNISENHMTQTMRVLRIAFLSSAVLELFSALSIALLAVFLGLSFLGQLNIGIAKTDLNLQTGLFILLLAPEFYLPLRDLGTQYHARADAIAAAENMMKIFKLKPEKPDHSSGAQPSKAVEIDISQTLTFNHVTHHYGNLPSLKDVSIQIEPGKHVAIVGKSGAGKTTFLNLLLKFIEPNTGQIKIGQTLFCDISQTEWLKQISWLGQSPKLFHGTIKENLYIANPKATEKQLWQALELAQAKQFVEQQSLGLNTIIGEQKSGLSIGQSQRLSLARAYLKNAPIFILDEPTASLDKANESKVLTSLKHWIPGKTVISSTHRIDLCKLADHIIVLDHGQVISEGSYTDLLSSCPTFQQLVKEA